MDILRVFVYGTLLRGHENHYIIEDLLVDFKAAFIKGEVYHLPAGYPALVLEGTDRVRGEVLYLAEPSEAILRLDDLEGYRGEGKQNLYNRVKVMVETSEGQEKLWCYVWPQTRRNYLDNRGIRVLRGLGQIHNGQKIACYHIIKGLLIRSGEL